MQKEPTPASKNARITRKVPYVHLETSFSEHDRGIQHPWREIPWRQVNFTGRPDCPSVLTLPENFDSHRWRSCDRKLQRMGDRTYKRSGNLVAKHGDGAAVDECAGFESWSLIPPG